MAGMSLLPLEHLLHTPITYHSSCTRPSVSGRYFLVDLADDKVFIDIASKTETSTFSNFDVVT